MGMVRLTESTASFASPGLRSETPIAAADGVVVRAALAEDTEALCRMLCRCSTENIRLRFHSAFRRVPRKILKRLAAVDPNLGRAIVAEVEGETIGHAMYVRDDEGDRQAEVAAIIEDEWSSRGIGQFLLKEISAQAVEDGVEMLICATLAENRRVRDLVRRTFPEAHISIYGGVRVMRFPLSTGVARPGGWTLTALPPLPANAHPSRFIDQGEEL